MKTAKIRRVGNSNVVTLPRVFERAGFTPGTEVVLEELPTGELLIQPVARLRGPVPPARQEGAGGAPAHGRGSEVDFWTGVPDIETLARLQGVKPVTAFDSLLGESWPEDEDDEDIDEFLALLYRWRDEGK